MSAVNINTTLILNDDLYTEYQLLSGKNCSVEEHKG